jgi:hypothetical protein
MLERVVSGGQTGVDQAGWRAARACGLATSGWMPKTFLTEDGPRPEFAELYGARETTRADYRQRTEWNVRGSDATVWLGLICSKVWWTTSWACQGVNRELLTVVPGRGRQPSEVADWIARNRVKVLNVAGDRESRNTGIGAKAERFLIEVFRRVLALPERPPPEIQGRGWVPELF